MDGLSIALGVLQITGVAIKGSLLVRKKIKCFHNYSREVDRVLKNVDRQQKNFTHEIHLLLRLARQDEDVIQHMLEHTDDPNWSGSELESELEVAFPSSLNTVKDIIEEIGSTFQDLRAELSCFDEFISMGEKNEEMKDTVRRLRKKVKITLNKENFEEQIKNLRELNDDLRRLREQATEIKQPAPRSAACVRSAHQLDQEYRSIGKVRTASKAFHQALAAVWLKDISETQSEEVRHNVRLKLDTQVRDDVKMEVLIACSGHSFPQLTSSFQPELFNLQVKSRVLDFVESGLNTPPHSAEEGHRKERKVHFKFDDNQVQSAVVSHAIPKHHQATPNLQVAQNICKVFQETCQDSCAASKCLGYLDSCCNETFRHSFFGMEVSKPVSESRCLSAENIISHPDETSVTFVDQLKLARSFAMAVLKFHSTPWLREYVTIQDLTFFRLDDADLSSCIQTAHLAFTFVHSSLHGDFSMPAEDMMASEAIEVARLAHGVRNLTLWGLGTVMLQIGRWSTLDSPDDVMAVRRLAQKRSKLGNRYRDLTKQCLECDFALGDDLSKPRLQQAVYDHVVCGLTEIIQMVDFEED